MNERYRVNLARVAGETQALVRRTEGLAAFRNHWGRKLSAPIRTELVETAAHLEGVAAGLRGLAANGADEDEVTRVMEQARKLGVRL